MRLITGALPIALQVVIVILLSRQLGAAAGAGVYGALTVIMVLTAGALIRTSAVGVVTWRNRVAGLLLPWSMIVGGGTMKALLIKNIVAGAIFGVLVVIIDALVQNNLLATSAPAAAQSPGWGQAILLWVTVGSWIIMLIAWLWVLRAQLGRNSEPISMLMMRPGVRFAVLAPPLVLAASIALRYHGYHLAAMLIITVPLLFVLGPVLVLLLVLLSYTLRGKPIRWN